VEASGILAASFDLSQTLPQVADLCVREIAEYCAIVANGPRDGLFVEASADSALRGQVVNAGAPLPEALRALGLTTVITYPVCGRQEILGTFILASRDENAFGEQTRKLANLITLQIANALDQWALFERTHRVADRLQRALLPESFPGAEGVQFFGAYRPASDEAEVGGDWYDAFALPDGRIAVSIGDVAGHGLEAATVMGEIRQGMRSVALSGQTPVEVLQHINGIINIRQSIGMVTAIFGYYEPQTRTLTYAVAGHPPPVVTIAAGRAALLPGGGIPLGVVPEIDSRDWTITLPPASVVTFYTDGMTEFTRDVLAGEDTLLRACGGAAYLTAENPADALQQTIFGTVQNRDDAAVLTLQCEAGSVPAEMRYTAIPMIAPLIRASLQRFADQNGLGEEDRFALTLAVGEAVANAVEHAYRGLTPGMLFIRTHSDDHGITVRIEDQGRWRAFERREERGRGITLMHEMMSGVRISSSQDRTTVILTLARNVEEQRNAS
ncbi:MAG: SpoIIE family protein phosphatase, partial [Candidatus Eremiobacteraeota bacterium]|nr:SpoIIE family protein phosphatase [Candidatus Eremiobacteraeota bacterium]